MAMDLIQKQQEAAQTTEQKSKQTVNQMMNAMLDGEKLRGRFEELLGKRTPQFISGMVSMVNADANMQKAFYQAPMTVIQSCLKAASFDLPIDQNLGYAYIVPFNNKVKDANGNEGKRMEATFILGWKGMHQLALRTGVYKVINVTDVREGELKSYNRLTEETVIDFIEDDDEREKRPIIGYVGYYRLINGAEKTVYMTKKQIENHERKFRKGQYMTKGWRDDWDAMARKTIYRKLIGKWGVMSIEYRGTAEAQQLAQAITDEEALLGGDVPDAPTVPNAVVEAEFNDVSVDESTGEVVEETE